MFRAFAPAWRLPSTNTAALVSSRTIRRQAVRFLSVTSQESKTQPDSYTSAGAQESVASGLKVMLPGQSSLNFNSISGKSASFMYSPAALPPRQDPLLHFLVNLLMRDGKKASAERYVADMLSEMARLTNKDPLPLVYEAVELAKPLLRMQTRKQGGKSLQVPMPLNERQSTRRALKWIIQASDRRADRAISRRLAVEMLAILEGNSSVLSRRDEQHKVGTINRANASVRI